MKRFFLLLATVAMATTSYAEGYQVNSLSAKQLGMGHVGTGMKLNSESLFFNPAATAFQTTKFDFSIGMTGISPSSTYTTLNDYTGAAPQVSKTKKGLSTPMFAYFNYKPTEDLAIGLAFNTPFGSSLDWGQNWAGAHLVQDITLQAFSVQPTISYKLWDKVSIGVGMSISWGSFELSRSMLPVGKATNDMISGSLATIHPGAAAIIAGAGNNALASATLQGDANIAYGVNLGVMYDINKQWTLGLAYRSKTQMLVEEGTTKFNYLNDQVKGIIGTLGMIPPMDKETFTASLPAPANVTFGASFRPTEKWEVAVDIQWVGWAAYENLNVVFTQPEPTVGGKATPEIPPINSEKNYKNTMIYRVGAQYHANKYLTTRIGLYVDESPVNSNFLNPETPSMTKIGYTAGLSIRPTDFMSIDISYGYIGTADSERFGSSGYENPLIFAGAYKVAIMGGASPEVAEARAKKAANQPFEGNYSVSAHMLSVGLSFNF